MCMCKFESVCSIWTFLRECVCVYVCVCVCVCLRADAMLFCPRGCKRLCVQAFWVSHGRPEDVTVGYLGR